MKSSAEVSLVVLNDLISVKTAVSFSGYSLQYIRRFLPTGKLVGLKIGQFWLIDKITFEAYLKNICKPPDRRYGPKNNNKS